MPEQSAPAQDPITVTVQQGKQGEPTEAETPAIEALPLIPLPAEDDARRVAVESITAEIEDSLIYSLADEQKAREIDRLFEELPNVPKGWLEKERKSGEIRSPWSSKFSNGTVGMALQAAALTDDRFNGVIAFLQRVAGYVPAAPDYKAIEAKQRQDAARQRILDELNHYASAPQKMQPWGAGASIVPRRSPGIPEPGSRTIYRG
ncbi:hypothetical protein KBY82_07390 [Cyanobium sp. AMD-g]|uniref:hypothetical protein n=1 Tax=Cyanobium sp. AMD-g TaxID=2823699 RepID=UPI0020CE06E8|nr:hypothetical protein [Cyanobium sp. AMD-g]MCP9930602.1 hypothetical protein [Cyanobium sp. AMD-g]